MKNLVKLIIVLVLFSCNKPHLPTMDKQIDLSGKYLLGVDTVYFTQTLCIYTDSIHYRADTSIIVFDEHVFFKNLYVKYKETDTSIILTDILNTQTKLLIKY